MHSVEFTHAVTINLELHCQSCGVELEISGEKEDSEADISILVAPHECRAKMLEDIWSPN